MPVQPEARTLREKRPDLTLPQEAFAEILLRGEHMGRAPPGRTIPVGHRLCVSESAPDGETWRATGRTVELHAAAVESDLDGWTRVRYRVVA